MPPIPLTPADAMLRLAGTAALTSLAVAHLWALPHKLAEATYMAVLFGLLVVAAMVLALALVEGGRAIGRGAWLAGAGLALSAMAGYLLSRTFPLPGLERHVGHWQDPLGTASLIIEASILLLAPLGVRHTAPRRGRGLAQRGTVVVSSVCAVGVAAVLAGVPDLAAADGASGLTPHEHHGLEVPGVLLLAGLLGGAGSSSPGARCSCGGWPRRPGRAWGLRSGEACSLP